LDVAAGVAAGATYLLLPAALGLDYRLLAQRGQYQLMWLNLLGAHYRLPIDTPKPLPVLLAGLLGSGTAFYIVTCVIVGLCVAAAMRLGKAITGSFWPGLLTAVAVFALRGECTYYVLTGGTEPFHIALILLTLVALADGRYRLATLAVFAACLTRPESWSLAPLPLLAALVTRRRFHVLLLLPFVAPFVWMGFDRALAGDWLYSLHVTSHYRIASGVPVDAGTGSFWGDVMVQLSAVAGDVPLVAGTAGLVVWIRRRARQGSAPASVQPGRAGLSAGHLALVIGLAIALPFAASWLASLSGHVLLFGRFMYPSAVLLTLLATAAPFLLLGGRAPRWLLPTASGVVALTVFVPQGLVGSIRRARMDEVRVSAYFPVADTVKRLVRDGGADVVLVSALRFDYFAKLLGPADSRRLLWIREVTYGARAIPVTARYGVLAYYDRDEINWPSVDSVISRVMRAWPTPAVFDTVVSFPSGRGGVWTVKSVPERPGSCFAPW